MFFVLPHSAVNSLKVFVLLPKNACFAMPPLSFMFVTPMSTCCPPFLPYNNDDDNGVDNGDDNDDDNDD